MKKKPAGFLRFWGKQQQRCLAVFLVLVLAVFSALQTYGWWPGDKIYPGVSAGSFPVGGLTAKQAEEVLQAALEPVSGEGLVFVWRDQVAVVPAAVNAAGDPDLSREIIGYDLVETMARLESFGRTGGFFPVWRDRLRALAGRAKVEPVFIWQKEQALDILKSHLAESETPGRNAGFLINNQEVEVAPERSGLVFDYELAASSAQEQLLSLIFKPIPLQLKREAPTVSTQDVEPWLPAARFFLAGSEVTASFGSSTWPIKRADLASALEVRLIPGSSQAGLGFSQDKFKEILESARQAIDIPAQEPKFAFEKNKVIEFQESAIGQEVDLEKTRELWEQEIINNQSVEVSVIVAEKKPGQRISDLNNLGIKELLGVGKSNFKGSPKNRRHNIKVGAEAVNGTLIAPGEEFSLLKVLGKVDAASGYLPELVIKGNKTTPEYGGGLCQIGTTTFRGTLAAGLPVTERRNHSYQVSYYANDPGLPGTDATIYGPAPDYRFKNDTANYVLIITKIEGDNLFFEYWGAKDGRQVEQSAVRVWDRVGAGPTKLIETLDLKPGEKKCTEKPHAGIKAAFDYKITYPDGQVSATTFASQYRPWPEVCLIGVEKLTEEEPAADTEDGAADNEPVLTSPDIAPALQ